MPTTKLNKTALTYALIVLTLFVEPSCESSMSCWKKWPNNKELKYFCNDYNQESCDICWKKYHRRKKEKAISEYKLMKVKLLELVQEFSLVDIVYVDPNLMKIVSSS